MAADSASRARLHAKLAAAPAPDHAHLRSVQPRTCMWRGRKKSDPPETRHARTVARGGPDAPPVSCVCATSDLPRRVGATRDTSLISHHLHDITPDTDTHTAFYSHGFGVIFTGDRSQLQSLYMTFSHVWRGTILRSLNDFRLTYACTVLYLHTPYPVPVSPSHPVMLRFAVPRGIKGEPTGRATQQRAPGPQPFAPRRPRPPNSCRG